MTDSLDDPNEYVEQELAVDYLPGEAVCPVTWLTYNKHLGSSPYAEWDPKKKIWKQTW